MVERGIFEPGNGKERVNFLNLRISLVKERLWTSSISRLSFMVNWCEIVQMGVKGLWRILEPVKQHKSLADLRGQIIAVDLSIWIVEAKTVLPPSVTKPHLRFFAHSYCLTGILAFRVQNYSTIPYRLSVTNLFRRKPVKVLTPEYNSL